MELVYLIIGIVVGLAIGWLLSKFLGSSKAGGESLATFKVQAEERQKQLDELNKKLSLEESEKESAQKDLATVEANYRNLEDKLREQKTELEEVQKKFNAEFQNLAQKILEEKSQKFTEQNKSNISEILNPLKEKIEKFEKKVEESSEKNLKWNSALKEQLNHLKELNTQITKDAENLTKALKGDSKTQGNWGEMQLEALLQKAGLEKDTHYFKEQNFKNEEGNNQRPDFIVKLPDDKSMIIDSKVSLTAYSNYFESEDEKEQERFLKAHLDSINNHIRSLSEKKYASLYQINQPDYIMMFLANEPALTLALKNDHDLYNRALDKKILLVSTTTLLASLLSVAHIWKQDSQSKNAEKIAKQAGDMYDKFVGFLEDLKVMGVNLDRAKDHYEKAMNKLVEGKGNLVKRSEDLRKLSIKNTKEIDPKIKDRIKE